MRRIMALAPLLLLTAVPTMTRADDKPETKTISVTGQGKIAAVPNVADINLGVVTQAETAREALSANTERMAALQKVLKDRGVASKDIQTTNINVSPRYSQPPQPLPGQVLEPFTPKIIGYDVTNTVTITARDLNRFGELLDAVVSAGANQMHGISFRVDTPDSLLDEARKRAMADARHKADLLAGEAGVIVGPPISIVDSGDSSPPPPRPMMMGRMMAVAAAPVPVAAGEQELNVTVHVVYELKIPQ
jgi:uncharacterized protein YggE